MPRPSASMVHVNRPLTNMSVAYIQSSPMIAAQVFPVVPVQKRGDIYFIYDGDDWARIVADIRKSGTESAGGGYGLSEGTYYAKSYGVHKDVHDDVRANSDLPLTPDKTAARWVTQQMLLKREKLWAASFFTTGVWTGSTTGTDIVPGTLWDAPGSDPVGDVKAERESVEDRTYGTALPNTMVVGRSVDRALKEHPDILDRISITRDKIVTDQLLASLFEVDRYLVAKAVEVTSIKGATEVRSRIVAADDALLVYANRAPALDDCSGGYTFAWKGLYPGGPGNGDVLIKRWYMDELESTRVEGKGAWDMKVVAPTAGVFFNGAVS